MTPCYYCYADGAACKACIHSDTYIDPQEEITKLREQVAAQAAVIESLKSAMSKYRDNVLFRIGSSSTYREVAREYFEYIKPLITIPTDSTQILDEVRRAERERCAKVCEEKYLDRAKTGHIREASTARALAAAIRAME